MGFGTRLLFVEPRNVASSIPVLDAITRKMCAAFRKARHSDYAYGGFHECYCGAVSSCCDYHLPSGHLTNSLCIHYLAHHRSEVDDREIASLAKFSSGLAEPDEEDLQGPDYLLARIRAGIERKLGAERIRIWGAWGLDVDALTRALRGGCLPDPEGLTRDRQDAEELYASLRSIPAEALRCVQASALRSHGDPRAWGAEALRVSDWDRRAWLIVLDEIIRLPEAELPDKRLVTMARRALHDTIEGGQQA